MEMFKTYYSLLSHASDESILTPNFIQLYKKYPDLSQDEMNILDTEVYLLIDTYLTTNLPHHKHILAAIMETVSGVDIPKSFNKYLDNFLLHANYDACELFINSKQSRLMIKMHYLNTNNVELFINLLNKSIIALLDNHTMVSLPIFPVNMQDRMEFLEVMKKKRILIKAKNYLQNVYIDTIYDAADYYSDLSDECKLGIML